MLLKASTYVLGLCALIAFSAGIMAAEISPNIDAEIEKTSLSASMPVPGCPHPIRLNLPEAFTSAGTPDEWDRQDKLLNNLHGNSARKARYNHVLMRDWQSEFSFPYIAVGTLDSLLEIQGQIDDQRWDAVKHKLLKMRSSNPVDASISSRIGAYQQQVNYRYNLNLNRIIDVIENDTNSLTLLGKFSQDHGNGALNVFSAAKIIRADRCVAVVNLFFYSEETRVADRLQQLSEMVSLSR